MRFVEWWSRMQIVEFCDDAVWTRAVREYKLNKIDDLSEFCWRNRQKSLRIRDWTYGKVWHWKSDSIDFISSSLCSCNLMDRKDEESSSDEHDFWARFDKANMMNYETVIFRDFEMCFSWKSTLNYRSFYINLTIKVYECLYWAIRYS